MEARGKSRSWGALPFGGNEAWSEIYTTRVRSLGLQEREKEEDKKKREMEMEMEMAKTRGGRSRAAAPPSQTTFPSKTKRLPDLYMEYGVSL